MRDLSEQMIHLVLYTNGALFLFLHAGKMIEQIYSVSTPRKNAVLLLQVISSQKVNEGTSKIGVEKTGDVPGVLPIFTHF